MTTAETYALCGAGAMILAAAAIVAWLAWGRRRARSMRYGGGFNALRPFPGAVR